MVRKVTLGWGDDIESKNWTMCLTTNNTNNTNSIDKNTIIEHLNKFLGSKIKALLQNLNTHQSLLDFISENTTSLHLTDAIWLLHLHKIFNQNKSIFDTFQQYSTLHEHIGIGNILNQAKYHDIIPQILRVTRNSQSGEVMDTDLFLYLAMIIDY